MLLGGHRQRLDVIRTAGGVEGRLHGVPPDPRIHLGAVGVRCPTRPHLVAGVGIPDRDLDGLGGGVDAGDQPHPRNPMRCSMANSLMFTNG